MPRTDWSHSPVFIVAWGLFTVIPCSACAQVPESSSMMPERLQRTAVDDRPVSGFELPDSTATSSDSAAMSQFRNVPTRLPPTILDNTGGVEMASIAIDNASIATSRDSRPPDENASWKWQLLPNGLMYPSYLAGNREPRLGTQWVYEKNLGWQWDLTAGGRAGLLRYGTTNDEWPEGFQWDIEGAALVRMNMEHENDVDHTDFRAGSPFTMRQGPWEFKFGYYHLSSHLGDEYMVRNQTFSRINYVRENLIFGAAMRPTSYIRLYSEVGWAFYVDGGAKPWEFQFGAEISPTRPSGPRGDPFLAVNCHLHEETDFSGNLTVQTGWQWRGRSGHLFRLGVQYFNGMSELAQFYDTFEEQIGLGAWYDF